MNRHERNVVVFNLANSMIIFLGFIAYNLYVNNVKGAMILCGLVLLEIISLIILLTRKIN